MSVYEAIGGAAAVDAAVDIFYRKVSVSYTHLTLPTTPYV